jgi:hypothetical protein
LKELPKSGIVLFQMGAGISLIETGLIKGGSKG